MFETIAAETNREERTECGENFRATSIAEINDFIRLCLLHGIHKGNMESIEKLFQ